MAKPKLSAKDGLLVNDKSPYGMEILVADQPRAITDRNGLGYVELNLSEEYQVRLTNDSKHEVAAQVQIDGVGIFHFSELRSTVEPRKGEPLYRYYIISPGKSTVVPGWFINNQKSQAFKITPFEQMLAAKVGTKSKLGMVTASYFASWNRAGRNRRRRTSWVIMFRPTPSQRMKCRQARIGKSVRVKTPLFFDIGTGFGQLVSTNAQGVNRLAGVERATLTLRYEKGK